MNRMLTLLLLLSAVSAAAQVPSNAAGVGDLLVAPTRVVLHERARTAEIALINTGSAASTYRISFRHLRMNEQGQLADVSSPDGERFADPYVLYTPQKITLQPGIAQTVRVRVRLPEDAEEGEYRTHLEFHGLPPSDLSSGGGSAEGSLDIKVVPIYGVSIPLLVRRGLTEAEVALKDLRVTTGEAPQATFWLVRSGTRSTYGKAVVRFTPQGGEEEVVGVVNGIAIYLPLSERQMTIPLHARSGAPLRNGVLRVTYVDADGTAGAPPVESHVALR